MSNCTWPTCKTRALVEAIFQLPKVEEAVREVEAKELCEGIDKWLAANEEECK